MRAMNFRDLFARMSLLLFAVWLAACGQRIESASEEIKKAENPTKQRLVISVEEQIMVTFNRDRPKRVYRVSTSKFGVGNKHGSFKTPVGQLEIVEIVGEGLPVGSKLKGRQPTGEIVPVNAPGRDPIVTRILRMRGTDPNTVGTFERAIYIHGTAAEARLETPASWGCVRMASEDIIELCEWIEVGARVDIVLGKLPAPNALPQ